MSKRKTKQHRHRHGELTQSTPLVAETPANPVSTPLTIEWSRTVRNLVSVLILTYLAIVVLGPLSNPIASRGFSAPLSRAVAPVHQALFLGHGYRFFGPDPGPTHRLLFRGLRSDGTEFSGHIPDRENNWPRLLYHRWFMLSETMFNEQILKPSTEQFENRGREYDRQISILRAEGKLDLLEQLTRERELETEYFQNTSQRVELLFRTVAQELMKRNGGQSIELFVQERKIPFPEEVTGGLKLDDPGLLMEPIKIGEIDANGFRSTLKVEQLPPTQEESK